MCFYLVHEVVQYSTSYMLPCTFHGILVHSEDIPHSFPDRVQKSEEQWLQYRRLTRQNPGTNGKSVLHHYDCICLVLPRWYLYQRKHQADQGSQAWKKGCKLVQIWTGIYITVPSEPHQPISDRYFQIFVIYLVQLHYFSHSTLNALFWYSMHHSKNSLSLSDSK